MDYGLHRYPIDRTHVSLMGNPMDGKSTLHQVSYGDHPTSFPDFTLTNKIFLTQS